MAKGCDSTRKGRCLCGKMGSVKQLQTHAVSCDLYAEAYRSDPQNVPSFEDELERWRAEEGSADLRKQFVIAKRTEHAEEVNRRFAVESARWADRVDILGED